MDNQCNGTECSTTISDCNCSTSSPQSSRTCSCPGCSGQNPIDFAMSMWHNAAMEALFEIKKEKIKEKLEKSGNPLFEKGADVVVEFLGKAIQATVQKSTLENELRTKISSIMKEIK